MRWGVWKIWHPKYGVVYDELEAIRRGRYASTRKKRRMPREGLR